MLSSLLFFLLLLLLTNFLLSADSFCFNDKGNYTANDTYSKNLDSALSSLPTIIGNRGLFYNASVGSHNSSDTAYAVALCKGDAQLDECLDCIRNITSQLRSECPNQRQAVQWRDACTLRYSDQTLLGNLAMPPPGRLAFANQNATDPTTFMSDLRPHLDNVREQAANGGPLRKVGYGNITANDFQYIFAMVQCSPDLSSHDCRSCLIDAARQIPRCCDGKRGGSVQYISCRLRYETYPFYSETRLQELSTPPAVSSPAPQPPLAPQTPPPSPIPPTSPPPPPGNNKIETIIIVVASTVSFVIVAVILWILLRKRVKRMPEAPTRYDNIDDISTPESLKYELNTLRAATNEFSDANKLGQGGFGAVYKGTLLSGKEIAVKRLSENSGQGSREFKTEVVLLAKLQHRNLVRLLGFCLEGLEKLLIYEFVENASLDRFIFDPIKRSLLNWETRYKIICGIARGILYLHEDSRVRIIHRDLKPSNVLLDGAMNPKIADFGLAKLFEQDDTHGNTSKIAGTLGYMSPEYERHGQFSVKSDAFSFGVLLLEIISGTKNKPILRGDTVENLLSFAWKNWCKKTVENIVDPCLRSASSGCTRDMLRCIHIGLLCVQDNAADRPTMASVVLKLNNHSLTMEEPTKPTYIMLGDYGFIGLDTHEHNDGESEYKSLSNSGIQSHLDDSGFIKQWHTL